MRIITKVCNYECISVKNFLKKEFDLSISLITKLKNSKGIILNGENIFVNHILKKGDRLSLHIPECEMKMIVPIYKPLDVLFEDEDIICVDKKAKMPTHPSRNHYDDTLANIVIGYLKSKNEPGEFHIVTRLDNLTSGIVIGAKNVYSASKMCMESFNRSIKKEYIALCRGNFKEKAGIIEANISRVNDSIIKRQVDENGKYAKTEYEVIKEYDDSSLVRFILHTGRTHQIRVHSAYIGNPLLNDFLYDDDFDENKDLFLHCHKVSFIHPITNKKINIISDI